MLSFGISRSPSFSVYVYLTVVCVSFFSLSQWSFHSFASDEFSFGYILLFLSGYCCYALYTYSYTLLLMVWYFVFSYAFCLLHLWQKRRMDAKIKHKNGELQTSHSNRTLRKNPRCLSKNKSKLHEFRKRWRSVYVCSMLMCSLNFFFSKG